METEYSEPTGKRRSQKLIYPLFFVKLIFASFTSFTSIYKTPTLLGPLERANFSHWFRSQVRGDTYSVGSLRKS
jgi:hypothetical protein